MDTGRPFSSFTGTFSPPWATDVDLKKNSNNDTAVSLYDARKREISELLKKERVYIDTLKSLVKVFKQNIK